MPFDFVFAVAHWFVLMYLFSPITTRIYNDKVHRFSMSFECHNQWLPLNGLYVVCVRLLIWYIVY